MRTSSPSRTPCCQGWEPFSHASDSEVGILVSHGFTGSTSSVIHLAGKLAEAGYNVECPRLSGHGTRWQDIRKVKAEDWLQDLEGALANLKARCQTVFVMGLSMGGTLVLRLAQRDPSIRGVVLINHALVFESRLVPLAGLLKHVVASVPSIASDIKDPDQKEIAYDRTPTAGVHQLYRLARMVRRDLPRTTQPLLIFKSREDHLVSIRNAEVTYREAGSSEKELVWLENSYHVATMDFDKDLIATRCVEFVKHLT